MALLTAVTVANLGCAHTQTPERRKSKKLQFPSINEAFDWLKEHTPEAPPGTHVVVAGVGFIIAIVGGALFLVPI